MKSDSGSPVGTSVAVGDRAGSCCPEILSTDAVHPLYRHTTTCRDVAKHIQQRLDYQLSRSAYRQIKQHLERCSNCTAYLDSLKKTVFLYRHEPDPRLPSRTRRKLYAVLHLHD